MIKNKPSELKIGNIHPGEVLLNEFLSPLGISQYKLAKDTNMAQTRIAEIIKGERAITCNTALKLARYFNTSPEFWIGLQNDYDMEEESQKIKEDLEKIEPCCV
ncbi:MAG: HigA family addiction module antitoxin [Syntrophomonadaceae bacterium]|nr:HigA family addiction module antitoxin [Syntrophomonadaceae bacterium]